MTKLKTISYFLVLLIAGCVEPFTPETTVDAGNILVVEGSLNPGGQSAQVKLSRAVPLDANEGEQTPREQSADVRVEELGGSDYKLFETGDGNYQITGINFNPEKKYRLKIRTITGSTYESEYVTPIATPPFDSVSWRTVGDVLSIEANTHDVTGKAKFFLWSFEDTYKYTSPLGSTHIWKPGGIVVPRNSDEGVYECWLTQSSTNIIIGTTRQLKENVIKNFRVNSIARGSIKLRYKYSVLVKQRAISEEEYEYWLELQKTTQNVGGLFDPMPAQVTGNLTCTSNPDEPVLGFFSAGDVEEERIFISFEDLPEYFQVVPRPIFCDTDSIPMGELAATPGPLYIVGPYGVALPEGYIISTVDCTDCTRAHEGNDFGTNKKPLFWED